MKFKFLVITHLLCLLVPSQAFAIRVVMTSNCTFQAGPEDSASNRATLRAGQSVTMIRTMTNGRTEYALPNGELGYRRSLASCVGSAPSRATNSSGPITLNWNKRRLQCDWGAELEPYIIRAERHSTARIRDAEEAIGSAVVNRPSGNLFVTNVSATTDIERTVHFRNSLSSLRRELTVRGIILDEFNSVQSTSSGTSSWECGFR